MRLFRCSPLWAVNKVAQNICRSTTWKPLLLPAMVWFGISSSTNTCVQNLRHAVIRLTRASCAVSSPRLALARKGEALALWCEGGYGSQTLWGSRYHPGPGWDAPQHLGAGEGDEGEARAALNSDGVATLVWVQTVGHTRHLLASTYLPGHGWSAPAVLDSTGLALSPQVLLDEEGNSVATWHRYEAAEHSYHFVSARRTERGWGPPSVIGKDQLVPTGTISGNGSGMVVALWNAAGAGSRFGELRHNTWGRIFDPVTGWGPAFPLGREIVQDDPLKDLSAAQTVPGHHAPVVTMDEVGNALALWQEVSAPGRDYQLKASRFFPEKGWGAPEVIGENPLGVSASLADGGIAFVCLTQAANWPDVDAYLSSLTVATDIGLGWFSEKVLDNYPHFCLSPTLLLGKDGQPVVTWVKGSGDERELWSASRSLSGWSTSERLDLEGSVEQYEAGWDEAGNVIVLWTQKSGTGFSVWGRTVQS
ncbi:hypothetical protein LPW11_22240 [Geomonas sp. RF6]|uniref:hypothetical protein n=1 Tax=Geomonas sp. RF6 TaxID=2897342 RepID=UPI001E497A06|nr:hypothetical protein [Geomonas sp. RF6]UFS70572.1 hypothetical protein LPW11_22240 [Geomonas sp. RF6]